MDILKVKEIEEKIINENIKKSDICSLFIGKIDDELLKELKLKKNIKRIMFFIKIKLLKEI